MRCIRAPQLAKYAFYLALFCQRDSHVETDPDNMAIELLNRKDTAKFVQVPAFNMYPTPKCHWLGVNTWAAPMSKKRNECNVSCGRLVETCWLRCTGVYGRNRRIRGHIAK